MKNKNFLKINFFIKIMEFDCFFCFKGLLLKNTVQVYFSGNANLVILLGMAVHPVVYFVLDEMWLHNYLATLPTALFGIIHVIITLMNYQLKH